MMRSSVLRRYPLLLAAAAVLALFILVSAGVQSDEEEPNPAETPGPVANMVLSATTDGVTVSWDTPDSGGAPKGYIVHLEPVGGNLESGATYNVWVRAQNTAGEGPRTQTSVTMPSDRAALIAIYNATNGPNWLPIRDWLSDKPIGEWEGVHTDNNRVTELHLNGYRLSGSMPWEHLTKLTELRALRIQDNQLSGSISPDLGKLSKLQELFLGNNQLSGSIPLELGELSNLRHLYLESNQLSGSIPPQLGELTNLRSLNLYDNQLSGSIPPQLGELTNLRSLNLYDNQLSGSIPPQLGELINLRSLNLYDNQLSGSIPPELSRLTKLEELYLSDNQLSGSIPARLGRLTGLEGLYLQNNQLGGSIPAQLGELTKLDALHLSENRLSGSIPWEHLTKLTELKGLYLSDNQLSGSIPPELSRLTKLEELYLSDNQLSGSIPRELGRLAKLEDLRLSGNRLSGSVPSELGSLTELRILSLDGNRLSGCFPRTFQRVRAFNPRHFYPLTDGIGLDWCMAPRVASAIADAIIVSESSTHQVSLSGVFSDANSDQLTVTAASSNEDIATVVVSADYSALTVTAKARGIATITVTADDGNGGTVSDAFTVTVKAAPVVASPIADASLEVGGFLDITLSDVFSDADGDSLTFTATSSNLDVANALEFHSELTIIGGLAGSATVTVTAQDSNGNRVSNEFDVTVAAPQQQAPPNRAPTVARALSDATIVNVGRTYQVSLSGVFSDPDSDALTITAASSDEDIATVAVATDQSSLTVTAKARGAATITVTADDGNGGTVSDSFDVTVTAPQPTPTPTPTPTPEPETETEQDTTTTSETDTDSETSDILARYDVNGNGKIDPSEYRQAIQDHAEGKITYSEMIEVTIATFR